MNPKESKSSRGGPVTWKAVKMITYMLSNHKPMMKLQHFAGIYQQSNNHILKPLFERFVSADICDVRR